MVFLFGINFRLWQQGASDLKWIKSVNNIFEGYINLSEVTPKQY